MSVDASSNQETLLKKLYSSMMKIFSYEEFAVYFNFYLMKFMIAKKVIKLSKLCAALGAAVYSAALFAAVPVVTPFASAPDVRWKLSDVYPSPALAIAAVGSIDAKIKRISECQGRLGESAAFLKSCLDLYADTNKDVTTFTVYAWEYFNQDTGDTTGNQLNQQANALGDRWLTASSFISPEILGVGEPRVHALIAKNPGLNIYRFQLDDILRLAPHTLSAENERIIARMETAAGSATSIYSTLVNAEMPWNTATLSDNTAVTLDPPAYVKYRASDSRVDRKNVFDNFFGKLRQFEGTLGETLYGQLKSSAASATVRGYSKSLSASLDAAGIPPAVYETLIAQANANLPTLHRYLRLRARMLGLSEMAYYDSYPSLVKSDRIFSLKESTQLMLQAVAPLGPDYVKTLAHATEAHWLDAFPRPRKVAGAHVSGGAYDVHPFILLNFTGGYDAVTTMTHEWGHAMHSVLSNRAQPSISAQYSIFVGEIASTTNEALLMEHMLSVAGSDEEELLYLGEALEGLRTTFFRQAMFAEFEAAIHARVDHGGTITGAEMSKLYEKILKRYNGDADGVMNTDSSYAIEWAYIPHFYNPFYVFQYATSIAAAQQFAQTLIHNEPGARERYLHLLSAGGSASPYDLVKAAGVDLASPEPYAAFAARMERIMDQIELIEAKGAVRIR